MKIDNDIVFWFQKRDNCLFRSLLTLSRIPVDWHEECISGIWYKTTPLLKLMFLESIGKL